MKKYDAEAVPWTSKVVLGAAPTPTLVLVVSTWSTVTVPAAFWNLAAVAEPTVWVNVPVVLIFVPIVLAAYAPPAKRKTKEKAATIATVDLKTH